MADATRAGARDAAGGAPDDAGFVRVAALTDLEPGVPYAVEHPSLGAICVGLVVGAIVAFRDQCSHREFPLSAGEILDDGTVECPWHGARFDCRSGAVVRGPAERPIASYDVRVDGDAVLVRPRPA